MTTDSKMILDSSSSDLELMYQNDGVNLSCDGQRTTNEEEQNRVSITTAGKNQKGP